ncbi:MAG: type II toxin-antitoxin system VapC family toxin [Thermofilaceae archaeon]
MKLLLDTSFIIELRRGSKTAESKLRELADIASDVGISALSLYELHLGASLYFLRTGSTSELAWLESFLSWVSVYPVTRSSAEAAARIKAEAMTKGLNLPDIDLLIATSAGPGTLLLTFDSDHEAARQYLSRYDVKVVYLEKR